MKGIVTSVVAAAVGRLAYGSAADSLRWYTAG